MDIGLDRPAKLDAEKLCRVLRIDRSRLFGRVKSAEVAARQPEAALHLHVGNRLESGTIGKAPHTHVATVTGLRW